MGGSTHAEGALQELEHPRYNGVKDDLVLPSKDNRIILLKLKTIHIARLKATELTSVSNIREVWGANEVDLFSKHNSIFQLTKRFEIVQHFKSALEECWDVKSKLPNLYRANIKKLTKKSQKKIMIFVVRLHFAMYVLNTLEEGKKMEIGFRHLSWITKSPVGAWVWCNHGGEGEQT